MGVFAMERACKVHVGVPVAVWRAPTLWIVAYRIRILTRILPHAPRPRHMVQHGVTLRSSRISSEPRWSVTLTDIRPPRPKHVA